MVKFKWLIFSSVQMKLAFRSRGAAGKLEANVSSPNSNFEADTTSTRSLFNFPKRKYAAKTNTHKGERE